MPSTNSLNFRIFTSLVVHKNPLYITAILYPNFKKSDENSNIFQIILVIVEEKNKEKHSANTFSINTEQQRIETSKFKKNREGSV